VNVRSIVFSYGLLWVSCHEYPLGYVVKPGRCWPNAIFEAVAWIHRWWLRMQRVADASYYYPCPSCGGKAFLVLRRPAIHEVVLAKDILHLSGEPMLAGDPIRCDLCGEPIPTLMLGNIKERR